MWWQKKQSSFKYHAPFHGLACLAPRLSIVELPNMAERIFSEVQSDAKTGKK